MSVFNDVYDRLNMDDILDCYVHLRIAEPGIQLPSNAATTIFHRLEEMNVPMFNAFFLPNEIHFASTIGYFDRHDIMNVIIHYLNENNIRNVTPNLDITAY